jgi:hypothetical protein
MIFLSASCFTQHKILACFKELRCIGLCARLYIPGTVDTLNANERLLTMLKHSEASFAIAHHDDIKHILQVCSFIIYKQRSLTRDALRYLGSRWITLRSASIS